MEVFRFVLLVLGLLQLVSAQPTTDPNEVAALKKLIDQWKLGSKINVTMDPCTENVPWAAQDANPRVECDCGNGSNTCHITHLKVYALDIKGEIPKELFLLKELTDLNLGQNVLNGSIPAEIGQLSNMKYLSLGINNLTGAVPPELGSLTKLLSLSFSSNNFFGPLPKDLGNLISLQQLYIDSSGVSGPIPQEFANLKSLQILWASDNSFTGKLPEYLGTFTGLKDSLCSIILLAVLEKFPIGVRRFWGFLCFGFGIHSLFLAFPTGERIMFVVASFVVTGIQHIQFCLNHFSSSVYVGPPSGNDWFEKQTNGTLDISCSSWMDWFHGGLQFQIEHHLFPRLPRCHLRKISPFVRELCKKHNLPYNSASFWKANAMTVGTLRAAALQARDLTKPVPKNLVWEAVNTHG